MNKRRVPPEKGEPPDSFQNYVGPVRPLGTRSRRVAPPIAPREQARLAYPAAPVFDVSDDGRTMRGVRRGFEDALSDVERDRLPIHETLDLHGMRSDEAQKTLLRSCKNLGVSGRRLILVVHGRGAHSPDGRGILRDEMASWLSSPPLAEHVLCFATAPARLGGIGAVRVLLARQK